MHDETDTQTTAQPESQAPTAPLSEDHAAALELASQATSPEDKAATADLVSEAAAQAETTEAGASASAAPTEDDAPLQPLPPSDSEGESLGDTVHDILTAIEVDIESLMHSPIALVAWVRSKVAEAKAKL